MGLSYFYNALMSPIQRHPGRLRRLVSPYGLHEANGARIAGWPHLVSLDTTLAYNRFRPKSSSFQPLSGEWIYGGVFYAGFGHFLIETLPNLFAVARSAALSSQRKALFFLQPNWLAEPNLPHYPSYCRLFFEYAGVDPDNFSFVTQPTEVERLIVGDSPFLKKFRYASWLLDTFDKEFSISRNTARKIYLSRSRWNHHLRLPGEPRIETIFSDYGYEIIHPQDLSIPKQIADLPKRPIPRRLPRRMSAAFRRKASSRARVIFSCFIFWRSPRGKQVECGGMEEAIQSGRSPLAVAQGPSAMR